MWAFFILKNFYLQLSKSHLPFPIWCGKRDNHFSRRKTGEHGVKRLTAKNKNWCQIGVKIEKITILKEIRYCKPLILNGLQKITQKISTHLLIMEVDFCPVLCITEVPVLQAFRGITHFVWYCKAVSDLS